MKRIIVAGLLGSLVMIAWMFVVNGLLGFGASINMNKVQNEREVYEVLKKNVSEPGRYVVNPETTSEGRYPDEEPVFSLLYSGMGHGTAGGQMILGLVVMILLPTIGAWLLAHSSERVLSSYPRKVFFFFLTGLLLFLFGDLNQYGIGGYPLGDIILLGLNHMALWIVVGLVIAWRIKPSGRYSMA
jgi:hypothetical protein